MAKCTKQKFPVGSVVWSWINPSCKLIVTDCCMRQGGRIEYATNHAAWLGTRDLHWTQEEAQAKADAYRKRNT